IYTTNIEIKFDKKKTFIRKSLNYLQFFLPRQSVKLPKDGENVIVLLGFVYAPKYDKRNYLRQVESIMYSFEWMDDTEKKS
ncbi:hypothetical protein B5F83_08905, partial [Muribaculum sp. An289]|uniref:DUF4837 family protein n=1 Tax=unclassified Muribaculum TaxID=2622126 RepID=UPI000B54FDD9